jgi:D-Tyr-tRNAtyr deacylase
MKEPNKIDVAHAQLIARSPEWVMIDNWIYNEIENTKSRLVALSNITVENVARLQEKIATLRLLRDTINKYVSKEE